MAHTFTNLWYHLIFGTKERSAEIEKTFRSALHAYVGGIVRECGGIPLVINGPGDHIHALVKFSPTVAVADSVRVIKTNSSKWIHEEHRRRTFSWQSGYAAFTVSESALPSVRTYVETQEDHHRKKTFREEYLEFLAKNGISYDPRYVFE